MRAYVVLIALLVLGCGGGYSPTGSGGAGSSSGTGGSSSSSSSGVDSYDCSLFGPGHVCGDHDERMFDACNQRGQCVLHEVPEGCWAGNVHATCPTCNDDNPCTEDSCIAGKCVHTAIDSMQMNDCDALGLTYCVNRSCCPLALPNVCDSDADCGFPGDVCLAGVCFVGCDTDPSVCGGSRTPASTCRMYTAIGRTSRVCIREAESCNTCANVLAELRSGTASAFADVCTYDVTATAKLKECVCDADNVCASYCADRCSGTGGTAPPNAACEWCLSAGNGSPCENEIVKCEGSPTP